MQTAPIAPHARPGQTLCSARLARLCPAVPRHICTVAERGLCPPAGLWSLLPGPPLGRPLQSTRETAEESNPGSRGHGGNRRSTGGWRLVCSAPSSLTLVKLMKIKRRSPLSPGDTFLSSGVWGLRAWPRERGSGVRLFKTEEHGPYSRFSCSSATDAERGASLGKYNIEHVSLFMVLIFSHSSLSYFVPVFWPLSQPVFF